MSRRDDGRHEALVAAASQLTAAAAAHGRVPPHHLDAERAVLAAVLLDNRALSEVDGILDPGDFYHPAHGLIFESIQAVAARRQPVDVVTLSAELRAIRRLDTVGGAQYLGELTDTIPTIAHVESHARIIADLAAARRVVEKAHEIVARGYGELGNPDEFLDWAGAAMSDAVQKRRTSDLVPLETMIQDYWREIESAANGNAPPGIPTGFRDLDQLIGGLRGGQLVIVAGRPAMGKTALAQAIARNGAAFGPVAMFSCEMQRRELTPRWLCSEARVDHSRVRLSDVGGDDMEALTEASNKLHPLPLYVDDSGGITVTEVRSKARALRAKAGRLVLIVVDYLQLMKGASGRRYDTREREISDISGGLKDLAKEMDVPIVALSQLNRDCEKRPDKRPQLGDLRESGALEQDADVVMFVYRDEVYHRDTQDRGIAEIIVAKQRSGPADTIRLRFIRELTRFESLLEEERAPTQDEDPQLPLASPSVPFDRGYTREPGDGL